MKYLITGGAGFIGSHLSEYLLRQGNEVYILDDLSTGSLYNIEHLKENPMFHYVIDSIFSISETEKLVQICDCIFHLAASVGVKLVIEQPLDSLQNNIKGTEIILDLAYQEKKRVLITSSSEVYGKNDYLPFTEEDDRVYGSVYSPRWGYAFSKSIDEFMALAYYKEKGLQAIVTRLFNTVGYRQTGAYGMVIPRFVKQAIDNEDITVYGDGKQSRCFTDVSDVVKALYALMNSDKTIGEVYNIGSYNEISIVNLANEIISMTNSSSNIVFIDYSNVYGIGFEDMKKRIPNISKIQNTVGYDPNVDLKQIINNVIRYFRDNNHR